MLFDSSGSMLKHFAIQYEMLAFFFHLTRSVTSFELQNPTFPVHFFHKVHHITSRYLFWSFSFVCLFDWFEREKKRIICSVEETILFTNETILCHVVSFAYHYRMQRLSVKLSYTSTSFIFLFLFFFVLSWIDNKTIIKIKIHAIASIKQLILCTIFYFCTFLFQNGNGLANTKWEADKKSVVHSGCQLIDTFEIEMKIHHMSKLQCVKPHNDSTNHLNLNEKKKQQQFKITWHVQYSNWYWLFSDIGRKHLIIILITRAVLYSNKCYFRTITKQ